MLAWHKQLAARGGWLVVDEAVCDAAPDHSIAAYAGLPNLVILRSLGKFFGLAGARVGFVLGEDALLAKVQAALGPWTINHPARWAAKQALMDLAWQRAARNTLAKQSTRLADLLSQHGLQPAGGCALFQWQKSDCAAAIYEKLAQKGVLVRLFAEPMSLRFGLPPNEAAWARLAVVLATLALPVAASV